MAGRLKRPNPKKNSPLFFKEGMTNKSEVFYLSGVIIIVNLSVLTESSQIT
jgi:hypothetical protein